jgi:hypothetical protein
MHRLELAIAKEKERERESENIKREVKYIIRRIVTAAKSDHGYEHIMGGCDSHVDELVTSITKLLSI